MTHVLKILPCYYEAVKSRDKNFELRFNDRNYNIGDTIILKCWDNDFFVNVEPLYRDIKYILSDCSEYGLMDGFVILGF